MGTRNSQDDAYNFCKGKAVKKSTGGYMVQKKTPYDWCVVTDHAVMLGLLPMTLDKSSPLYKTKVGALIRSGVSMTWNYSAPRGLPKRRTRTSTTIRASSRP